MIIDTIDISPLLLAFKKFESFRTNTRTEHERAGTIQAFEYTYELVWRTMKRLLEVRGQTANSPREVFRLAVREGFISDPELWFYFLKMRNITVHTYHEDEARQVYAALESFSQEVIKFFEIIGVPHNAYQTTP